MPNLLRFVCYFVAVFAFLICYIQTLRGRTHVGLIALGLAAAVAPLLWDAAEAL